MTRPDLAHVGQRQQLVVQGVEDPARALLLVDRQVRPRHVAHEERVPAQHCPRLGAARGVHEREGGVLGTVPRRVQRADRELAERELPAVVEGLVVVLGRRLAVDVDHGAGGGRQAPVARHVVRVVVRLEDVLDPRAEIAGDAQVFVDVQPRIDHGGHSRVIVTDHVARAAEVVVDELPEDHPATLRPARESRAAPSALG